MFRIPAPLRSTTSPCHTAAGPATLQLCETTSKGSLRLVHSRFQPSILMIVRIPAIQCLVLLVFSYTWESTGNTTAKETWRKANPSIRWCNTATVHWNWYEGCCGAYTMFLCLVLCAKSYQRGREEELPLTGARREQELTHTVLSQKNRDTGQGETPLPVSTFGSAFNGDLIFTFWTMIQRKNYIYRGSMSSYLS
ncbi:hypothetical protein F5050DRAFT_1397419 [Lentinula boryana]|uniref:Uncharacterized protein n=1 Tax=Lentinula boryana TaxID=40481 RepID=A0ABQ8QG94_9AGAR|nr:hypothetical protein F5050DRAFT_1397419 [Lentinula boryana]